MALIFENISISTTTTYGSSSATLPDTAGIYSTGQLNKSISIDKAGHQVIEYKDKDGQLILKKVQLADSPGKAYDGWLCTYYVYDDLGSLRFVILNY
ncbi:hypothetical protein SIO70_10070 [Chitinophaga sancti]|uniref:hypothetical protein n=1 Tax=Chitinophaga sancti TaxID=1004 RepID=UPI002A75B7A1|nr:hypothetical protein [Chitinophaga sancti]WPQ65190.1 hypothetical protein SIO70_10070 [Chitinophaga sancti]